MQSLVKYNSVIIKHQFKKHTHVVFGTSSSVICPYFGVLVL